MFSSVKSRLLILASLLAPAFCGLVYYEPLTPESTRCFNLPVNAMRDQCCFEKQPLYGNYNGFCPLREWKTICPENTIFRGLVSSSDSGMEVFYDSFQTCKGELYQIVYQCCPCAWSPLLSTAPFPNDDPKAKCVGCGVNGEVLKGNPKDGFSCSNTIPTKTTSKTPAPTPTPPNNKCKTNDLGVKSLLDREKFRTNFYNAGEGDVTIGYGHDCTQNKDCSSFHPPLTTAQALAQFRKDLVSREVCVGKLPNAKLLNANQFAALVSFTYNSGCSDTNRFFKSNMQRKDFAGIANALPTTSLGNPKVREGLKGRRKEEQTIFNTPTKVMSGC